MTTTPGRAGAADAAGHDALFGAPVVAGVATPSGAPAGRHDLPVAGSRVAQIAVEVPLPHLDRAFDYLVPDELAGADGPDDVVPGTRVKVRFAGRERDGWVLGVRDLGPEDVGRRLTPVRRLVSPVASLTPAVLALARAVADRYAGTLTDVLRFAVPPRHARAEAGVLTALAKAEAEPRSVAETRSVADGGPEGGTDAGPDAGTGGGTEPTSDPDPHPGPWADVPGGPALLRRLRGGEAPRAVWTVVGGPAAWREALVVAAREVRAAGRGVLVVVPDLRDVDALVPYLTDHLGEEVARLVASDGPSVRARAHLRALTGLARVVVGTRSAAWAPVDDLGLVVCWDDGDDSLVEQRSPYPHAAQVLAMRALPERTAVLIASPSRSVWSQHLVETGWAVSLRADRGLLRALAPRVSAPDAEELARSGPGGHARIPTPVWEAVRAGLAIGPVLVQTPRAGYLPHLACGRCRTPARCAACGGTLTMPASGPPVCGACGTVAEDWHCPECGSSSLRAVRVGSMRTAEELGRAFPQTPVTASESGHGIVDGVDAAPRIVVATPGAEPEAEGGYACVVLLDGALATSLPGLSGSEEALRRWFAAAWLARPASDGGRVVVVGGGTPAVVQALVRWDAVGHAQRELAERAELRFPPSARVVTVTGSLGAVTDLRSELQPSTGAEVLGPFPVPPPATGPGGRGRGATEEGEDDVVDPSRLLLRSSLADGAALSRAVKEALGVRSAHKRAGSVRVVVDPRDL
ncbi:primosomal protein N' family DNA-binding protein [Serinibacter arcticus]|uniref:Probable replication restart protein PriA n=1 Tax=Serinibacter arcticus TaxID=1655435 RepID=A0A4Z1DYA4_9MICO|nr:primosomal protein N' [Serinibacter arcticus]TGO04695.1 Helicase PriA essential for oriC/DnaA-independent DNA replication [Serinibacter arcticus]